MYSDGANGTITVNIGQFRAPDAASAFAVTALAGSDPSASAVATADATPSGSASASASTPAKPSTGTFKPSDGDVMAGGTKVGTYRIIDNGDGTGTAVWTNGTTVVRAVAPLADIADVYALYSY